MGTFTDSKIQRARKEFQCVECNTTITIGSDYLRYAMGLKRRIPVHLSCATKKFDSYRCRAIEEMTP